MEDDFVKQLLEYANNATKMIIDDRERYKDFLAFLSRYDGNQRTLNKLLIYGYDPEATDVRTLEEWNREGVSSDVFSEAVCIYLLEYNESLAARYTAKLAFDIRYTIHPDINGIVFQDSGEFAETLLASVPCNICFSEEKQASKEKCLYNSESKEILVTNDFKNYEEISHNLIREYAHYFLDEIYRDKYTEKYKNEKIQTKYEYRRDAHKAEALSACFMVCSRFNCKVSDIPFIRRDNDTALQSVRAGLDNMNIAFRKIVSVIYKGNEKLRESYEQMIT